MSIHKVYKELTKAERVVVDNAWAAVHDTFRKAGYSVPHDDRAEVLVEALAVTLTQAVCLKTTPQLLTLKQTYLDALEDALIAGDMEEAKAQRENVNRINASIAGV